MDDVLTRSTFETELALLGYDAPDSYDVDPCSHGEAPACALFIQQGAACFEDPKIYRDLKWVVYTGCRPCCDATEGVVMCGGLYNNVRLFVADLDATATSGLRSAEVPPARDPLPCDDPDD